MSTYAHVGAADPEAVTVTVWDPSGQIDLEQVSSVACSAVDPAKVPHDWSPISIVEKTASKLVARYVFAANGLDLDKVGPWRLYLTLTMAGGSTRRARPALMQVRNL